MVTIWESKNNGGFRKNLKLEIYPSLPKNPATEITLVLLVLKFNLYCTMLTLNTGPSFLITYSIASLEFKEMECGIPMLLWGVLNFALSSHGATW